MATTPRKYNEEMTKLMIRAWCDKAERAHLEVKQKLVKWGVPSAERDELMVWLIQANLLNEQRYASAFANDKFRFYQWGKHKIEQALKRKGVSARNIQEALRHIPDQDATEAIDALIAKRWPLIKGKSNAEKAAKLMRYLFNKGFDQEQIRKRVFARTKLTDID